MAKTILLADDSVTIQKVVELTFMDQDYQVIATGDGEAALEQLPAVNPDLVIADVHMPRVDGYEVCRRTKENHPGIPVLLLVGTFEQFDEQKAAEVGADGHLKKPFDSQDLLNQVDALIAGSGATPAAEAVQPAASDLEPPPLDSSAIEVPASPDEDVWSIAPPAVASEVAETAAIDLNVAEPGAASPEPPAFELEAAEEEAAPMPAASIEELEAPPLEAPPIDDFAPFDDRPAVAESAVAAEPAAAAAPSVPEAAATPPPVAEAPSAPSATESAATEDVATENVAAEAAATEPAEDAAAHAANGSGPLSDDDVERIARRVAELVGEKALRDVAWEVLPDLAEVIIKERISELESQVV